MTTTPWSSIQLNSSSPRQVKAPDNIPLLLDILSHDDNINTPPSSRPFTSSSIIITSQNLYSWTCKDYCMRISSTFSTTKVQVNPGKRAPGDLRNILICQNGFTIITTLILGNANILASTILSTFAFKPLETNHTICLVSPIVIQVFSNQSWTRE